MGCTPHGLMPHRGRHEWDVSPDRVGKSPNDFNAGSAGSADHDSIRRMPRISSRMRFGELWLPELRCPLCSSRLVWSTRPGGKIGGSTAHRRTSKCRIVDLVIGSPAFAIDTSDLDLAAGIDRSPGIVAAIPPPRIPAKSSSAVISQRAFLPARNRPKICTVSATEFADFLRNLGYLEETGRVFSKIRRSRALSGLTRPLLAQRLTKDSLQSTNLLLQPISFTLILLSLSFTPPPGESSCPAGPTPPTGTSP